MNLLGKLFNEIEYASITITTLTLLFLPIYIEFMKSIAISPLTIFGLLYFIELGLV